MLGVDSRSERLCAAGWRLQNEHVLRRTQIEQEIFQRARERRQRRGFVGRCGGQRPVTVGRFHQAKFAKVTGQSRLCDAHAQVPELAAQLVLARHGLARENLQNLSLPKSFLYAHVPVMREYARDCIIIHDSGMWVSTKNLWCDEF